MANARELQKRGKSVQSTAKITRTMELVASAKLKKAQDAAAAARPYADGLSTLLGRLSAAAGEGFSHPLMENRPVKRAAVLVATSDRGLCGAFNANLVRAAIARIQALRKEGAAVHVVALAKKAANILRFLGEECHARHHKLVDDPKFDRSRAALEPFIEQFLAGGFDRVEVIYSHFQSAARQTPQSLTLLPAGAVAAGKDGGALVGEMIYHPDPVELLSALVPQAVQSLFFSALLQTYAGEQAARRLAMKNATDAAKDLAKSINRRYNRARQGKITQEIAEIVGAVEAMA